jgi:acetyl esterase/lipase
VCLATAFALRCGSAPPAPGPFYTSPAKLREPGHLIRSQPLPGSPPGSKAWKILYVSTGLDGELIEVSGVVVAPDLPAPVARRHVVAWAHPTTGVADNCAPSVFQGFFDTVPHLPALIALDYVVAATDYPGLGTPGVHPYLVGVSEARGVLDAVRAARQIEKAGAGKRFVVWGHSQGGHAALFAGQLAKEYAPELTLAGVAAIAPATELMTLLSDDLSERAGRVLGAYALWSWSRVYGATLDGVVGSDRIPIIDRIARDCIETEGEGYRILFDSLVLPADFVKAETLASEPWSHLIAENRPGQSPTGAPIYVAQGTEDLIVRPSVTADFVEELCRKGERVQLDVLPGTGHMRASRVSATAAIRWMRGRFDGARAPSNCPPP